MIAKTEVVVGGEIDDLLAVIGADGPLFIFKDAQLEVCSALLQIVKLFGQMGKLRTS